MVEINDPINIWTFFSNNSIQPHVFFWKNRRIKIDKVNLMHTSRDGNNIFYHFSVSAGSNYYRLKFDIKELKWFLEAVEEGE